MVGPTGWSHPPGRRVTYPALANRGGATVPLMRRDGGNWLLPLALLLTMASSAGADDVMERVPGAHIRPASREARQLIAMAASRSPTVVRLIDRLAMTDVIVYVQLMISPQVDTARTALATSTANVRFVRIVINARTAPWDQVEMLGHELQHALEIAAAREVIDEQGMRELFGRIGLPGRKPNQFETLEAQRIQALVRRDYAR